MRRPVCSCCVLCVEQTLIGVSDVMPEAWAASANLCQSLGRGFGEQREGEEVSQVLCFLARLCMCCACLLRCMPTIGHGMPTASASGPEG